MQARDPECHTTDNPGSWKESSPGQLKIHSMSRTIFQYGQQLVCPTGKSFWRARCNPHHFQRTSNVVRKPDKMLPFTSCFYSLPREGEPGIFVANLVLKQNLCAILCSSEWESSKRYCDYVLGGLRGNRTLCTRVGVSFVGIAFCPRSSLEAGRRESGTATDRADSGKTRWKCISHCLAGQKSELLVKPRRCALLGSRSMQVWSHLCKPSIRATLFKK